jgi:hypothetical protein
MKLLKSFVFLGLLTLFINGSVYAQQTGSISGQVFDSLGAVVTGATVIAVDAGNKEKSVVTNKEGAFSIKGLPPGKYTVRVVAPKFSLYENTEVEIKAGADEELTVALAVEAITAQVEVGNDGQVNTDADANASATILKGKDIEDLPDDPDELQSYLQALAGPTAGPDGAQFMIDGFSGGRMPPKEAIREIRVNANPFSAEFERVGFGRVEILTKPGFSKTSGSVNFNFNDESLNSRNPFALNRASSQVRNLSGFLSGPIQAKKSSYFIDVQNSQVDSNAVVTATVLDPSLNYTIYNQDIKVPTRRLSIGSRLDYQLNDNNTLSGRYNFSRNKSENQGIGGFSLPSRAFNSTNTNHEFNLTESMIINPKTVNETRFQFETRSNEQNGDNSIPTVSVASAFTGGGAQIGLSYNDAKRWELNNATTTAFGKNSQHAIKFGGRVRGITIESRQESNYGGTFTFAGVRNPLTGEVLFSSIEQYRQKVAGNTNPIFNPTQFSLTTGNPVASVTQYDYSFFMTDDWKARKDLTVSFGLRYENQTNISDNSNFAPRIGVAWAPGAGGAKQPKTVFRGGFGLFYDRFNENNTLRAIRNDGVSQLNYVVTDPLLLGQPVFSYDGSVKNVPTEAQLAAFAPRSSIPFRIADDTRAPYSIQTALSVERQLPFRTTLSATFIMSRSLHLLRQRNINAPVCPTVSVCGAFTTAQVAALRPDPTQGNIYQIESSGYSNTKQLSIGFNSRLTPRVSIFGGYNFGIARGDTDSLNSPRIVVNAVGFPAYSYDLSNEFAESAFVPRHNLFMRASFTLPWNINVAPMIMASSGRRFNITSGVDTNRDALFFERPSYAALNARCLEVGISESYCDLSGISNPDAIIPRNYGKGPGTFLVNLNFSKTFGFGGRDQPKVANNQNGQGGDQQAGNRGGNRGGGNRGGGGGNRGGGGGNVMVAGGGGGFMGGPGGDARKPYNLTFGVNVQNLFNNVNYNSPQGSLTSPFFGRSTSTSGGFGGFGGGGGGSANRRIDLSLRFSF